MSKTEKMTFREFRQHVERSDRKDQRLGQFAFNELFRFRSDLSEQIRTSDFDPFYQDKYLPEFWYWVEQNWGEPDAQA